MTFNRVGLVVAMALACAVLLPSQALATVTIKRPAAGELEIEAGVSTAHHQVDIDYVVPFRLCPIFGPCNNDPYYEITITGDGINNTAAGCNVSSSNAAVYICTPSGANPIDRITVDLWNGNDTVRTDPPQACAPTACLLLRGTVSVPMTVLGFAGNDVLEGGAAHDTITGGFGNDTLHGKAGNDELSPGDGDDTVTGGAGDENHVDGGPGTDRFSYDDGRANGVVAALSGGDAQNDGGVDDSADGNAREALVNFERLTGSGHGDTLTGDGASNVLDGAGGNDTLNGGDGNSDTVNGGDGDDVLDGGGGSFDVLNGGAGAEDMADFSSRGARVVVDLTTTGVDGIAGENDQVNAGDVENLRGTALDDVLTGNGASNTLIGGGGPDALNGGAGADTVSYAGRGEALAVTLNDGASDDGGASDGAAGARDTVTNTENVIGGDADDLIVGDMGANTLSGGAGSDVLRGRGATDTLRGDDGADVADYADKAAGEPVTLSLDGVANDGEAGENDVFESIEIASGGSGADTLSATVAGAELRGGIGNDQLFAPNGGAVLRGGFGNDTLTGGDGGDQLFGDDGDDNVEARDGVADGLDCGEGFDTALTDNLDTRTGCEAGGTDADRDGFSNTQDCNDFDANIRPNATERGGNDVDENCDGVAADRDGDGFAAPQDCNDRNRRIRPNARDIPGNKVDENCDRRLARFTLPANLKVPIAWERFVGFTRLTKLQVTGLRAGAKVTLTCGKVKGKGRGPGCPFATKKVKVRRGKANATRLVRRARFRTGAVLRIRVTTPGFLAITRTARFQNAKNPRFSDRCQAPGAKKPQRCR